MRLFSYINAQDGGYSPNPYHGVMTLNCCKPKIRRAAQIGDWVAGITAADSPAGRGRLVYAMRVTDKMTMAEYDRWTQAHLPAKIPTRAGQIGDSQYDFSVSPVWQRPGAHGPGEASTDLRGAYTLLSGEFWYFGASAVEIPEHLREISRVRRGHRSNENDPYVGAFEEWITSEFEPGIHGAPALALQPAARTPVTIGRPKR
jgi:Nucleotide modification associated domain 2